MLNSKPSFPAVKWKSVLILKLTLFNRFIPSQRNSFCEEVARHLRYLRKIKQVIPT